jgi:DNA-binding transcriptional LysR family regulator
VFSLSDLSTLIAVAEHKSVRAAAAALGRTQPAITQAVRRLEEAVGFPLLDRSSYRARLTERGESFLSEARQTLRQAERLRNFSDFLASGIEPRLRLEVDSSIPPSSWVELLKGVREMFAKTVIEIECGEGTATLRKLLKGEADLALLFDFAVGSDRLGLDAVPVGAVDFYTAVQADKEHLVDDENALFPQVLVTDFATGIPEFGAVPGQHFWRVSNHSMQAEAILAGLGWGTTPSFMVSEAIADGRLQAKACFGLAACSSYSISLYRRKGTPIGPVAEHIWSRSN